MSAGSLLFALCALLVLTGGLGVLFARSPIRAALSLLATIVGVAGLFLRLGAELLAAVELIVYAGAVVVLFVFVIMIIGPDPDRAPTETRSRIARWVGGALALVGVGLGMVFLGAAAEGPTRLGPVPQGPNSVETLGRALFTQALVPFELTTALLVVAAIGAMAIARSRPSRRSGDPVGNDPRRFFGGPLHPRDSHPRDLHPRGEAETR